MGPEVIRKLGQAFHDAADVMRIPSPEVLDPTGKPYPPDVKAEFAKAVSADVLRAIGDVFLTQAGPDA